MPDGICLWSHVVLAFCFLENFKSEFQFQYIWCVSLYFLFLPGSYLENCTTLIIGPFLLSCAFHWHILASCILLQSSAFLWCQLQLTSPCLILLSLTLSLLFLMGLAKGLSLLLILSKNQLLVLFTSVQSLSCVRLFATPWTTAHQLSLSITNSWSLLKLMPIELMMPSNHLILPFFHLQSFPASGSFPMSQQS